MSKGRLEAFSDGVIAILITIMVLDLKVPAGVTIEALAPVRIVFLVYVLSFVYLGIYWVNHHHLFQATTRINGAILWANLHLLFWLSLVPYVTRWMSETGAAPIPTATYGVVLFADAIAFTILTRAILAIHERTSTVAAAIGRDMKGKISLGLYGLAIALAFVNPWLSILIYFTVGAIWLIPDRRIESRMS